MKTRRAIERECYAAIAGGFAFSVLIRRHARR